MNRARAHQQQPPNAAFCYFCGEGFNNHRRAGQHVVDKAGTDEKHPPMEEVLSMWKQLFRDNKP